MVEIPFFFQDGRGLSKPRVVIGIVSIFVFAFSAVSVLAQTMITPGKVDVSAGGAANYTVPISIPPGTAGMVPSISLQYNSQGGDGPLGVGWAVTGLSEIDRCGKTIAQDGAMGGINFDANDRYCLDGKRLVAISGTYGADGTEYRTEIESFSRIISHGTTGSGPTWWEVRSKSGQTLEFGNTADSKAMLSGIASIKSWMISKIKDTKGNYVSYTYTNNFTYNNVTTGEVLPSSILYTGNTGAGLTPYNHIEFVYAARPDVSNLYHAGIVNYRSQRLTDIKTWAGSALVADYKLTYEQSPSTSRSRVISVSQCDGNSVCLPATNFGWKVGGTLGTFTQVASARTGSESDFAASWTPVTGDYNGDGKTDVAFFAGSSVLTLTSNGDGTFVRGASVFSDYQSMGQPPTAGWAYVAGDFNSDGKTDVAFFANRQILAHLSNGNGTFAQVISTRSNNMSDFGSPPTASWTPVTGDYNGDGKTDVAFFAGSSVLTLTSNGDGTFAEGASVFSDYQSMGQPPTARWAHVAGDFNGDGKADVAFFANSQILTHLSNGNGTFTQIIGALSNGRTLGSPPTASWAPVTGDFNSDGKTDVAFFDNRQILSFLSNGDGTFTQVASTRSGSESDFAASWTPVTGDYNGDGKTDVAFFAGSSVLTLTSKGDGTFVRGASVFSDYQSMGQPPTARWAYVAGDFNSDGKTDVAFFANSQILTHISKGDGTFTQVIGALSDGRTLGSPPSTAWSPVIGDYDGDGTTDVAFLSNRSVLAFLSSANSADLLTSVSVPSFDATTTLSYLPLTNSTVYTKGTGAAFPKFDYQGPVYVVSSLTSPNGVGGTYSSTYKYAGARVHATGRGFLGFESQAVKDSQTNVEQTTNYLQDFPYTGLASSQTKMLGAVTLNSVTNTYGLGTLPWTGTNFPRLSQKVTTSKDLDGTALPTTTTTYTYDSYGNATQVVNGTSDGASQKTVNTYNNDTTNWYLGRLTGSTVTSVKP